MSLRNYVLSSVEAVDANPLIINAPAGVADGDVITLVALIENAEDSAVTWPAGFTQIAAEIVDISAISASRAKTILAAQKVASSEPASYTISDIGGIKQGYAFAHSGRSGTVSTPIYTPPSSDNSGPTTYSTDFTGYSAAAGDDVIVVAGFASDTAYAVTDFTPPAGYTEQDQVTAAWLSHSASTLDNLTAGATGPLSVGTTIDASNSETFGLVIPLAAAGASNTAPVVDDQTFSVADSASNGTVIGTLVATDSDGTVDSYAISGTTLAINSTTGQITLNDNSGIVAGTPITATATVTDDDGDTDTATITVNVTNAVLTDTLLDAENSNAVIANDTGISVHVYDTDGGTELYSTASATTDGSGVMTIDDDAIGVIGDSVFVIVKRSNGQTACGTMSVTDGAA